MGYSAITCSIRCSSVMLGCYFEVWWSEKKVGEDVM